jgi:hypothetical protein
MPGCKAPEVLRHEAYLDVRHNAEGRGKRSRWAFFSSLKRNPANGADVGGICNPEEGLATWILFQETKGQDRL